MVTMRIALALGAIVLLTACGGKKALGPADWRPIRGQQDAWVSGSGSRAQEYRYVTRAYGGTLQDLASRVTIDALTRHHGAKLQSSTPFPECPGAAAVATFRLPGGAILEEGFAVRSGQAVLVHYRRPAGSTSDRAVVEAMQTALCVPPV